MKRRTFLKGTMATSMVGVAVGAGLLSPRVVLAAWPESAFSSKNVDDALNALHGTANQSASSDIKIKAPDIAENGAVVPITVSTGMSGVETISVMVEKNPQPLACNFNMGSNTEGFVSTRIKMGKTSDVVAVVKSGGKLYSANKKVKVTIGGCGG
jgi:sulfur-oxidizing protein SoxY